MRPSVLDRFRTGPFFVQAFEPTITDINFTSSTLNNVPNKVGWRFFRVPNIAQQLGHLGWDLGLTATATRCSPC